MGMRFYMIGIYVLTFPYCVSCLHFGEIIWAFLSHTTKRCMSDNFYLYKFFIVLKRFLASWSYAIKLGISFFTFSYIFYHIKKIFRLLDHMQSSCKVYIPYFHIISSIYQKIFELIHHKRSSCKSHPSYHIYLFLSSPLYKEIFWAFWSHMIKF